MGRAKIKITPTEKKLIRILIEEPGCSQIIPNSETKLIILHSLGRSQGRVIEKKGPRSRHKKECVHIYSGFTFQAGVQTKLDVFPLSRQKELVN
jgi:hypothetical protein